MGILYMKRWVQMRWMYLNRRFIKLEWEHAVKLRNIQLLITCLIFDRTIGMLHLKLIILKRGIQLNKNFSHLTYPALTITQNDEKLHILDSNSLVIIFYIGILYMKRWVQMRLMYLNRSFRKLEWEYAVKLRNIQLLITFLILIIT